MAMVFAAHGLQGNEKLLLLAYLAHADETGSGSPAQKELAADCGTSISTVMRANQALIAKNLITLNRRLDPESGDPVASHCQVHLDNLAALRTEPSAKKPSNRQKVSTRVRIAVFVRDGNKCVRCGTLDDLSLDHIQPVSRGGGNEPENLRVLCRPCNSSKGARLVEPEVAP